jgi:glutathione S-transferase
MADLLLYSAKGCPFAHRTRLVLAHKQIPYELVEIDLQNKPVWYSDVSIYGKVPAIQHDGYRIVESSIINEYLDEVFTARPLLPRRPSERALARILIDYANTRFVPAFGALLRERDIEAQVSARRSLVESLRFIERSAFPDASQGPFTGGSPGPGLVDFTF